MENFFVFTNSAGKTQLRGYVKISAGLFVLMVALFGVNAYNRYKMNEQVLAAPRPVDAHVMPTVIPATAVVQGAPVETCPSDPAQWTLTNNPASPSSNLKYISQQCVLAELNKTAAWLYSTYVLGHSRQEAANIFGFSTIPMSYSQGTGQITVLTDFKAGPQKVDIDYLIDNSGLSEWRVDAQGHPAVEFIFSGCFRTSSMNGAEVTNWGEGFPVVCQYFTDEQTQYIVSSINNKAFTLSGPRSVRRTMWFGYAGSGNWAFLGIAKDWDAALSKVQHRSTPVINPEIMAKQYGVSSLPLPENWAAFTSPEFADAFVKEFQVSK